MQDNTCVCCGRIIPEGRQVCPSCEQKYTGGCTDCVHAIDDFGRCLIAKMFDCRVNPEHGCSWKVPIKRRAIQTNGDRIRAMSDAQLVGFIVTALSAKAIECDYCIHRDEVCRNKRPSRRCATGMIEWLRSEVRNE